MPSCVLAIVASDELLSASIRVWMIFLSTKGESTLIVKNLSSFRHSSAAIKPVVGAKTVVSLASSIKFASKVNLLLSLQEI